MDLIKCARYTIPACWTIMFVPIALQLNTCYKEANKETDYICV